MEEEAKAKEAAQAAAWVAQEAGPHAAVSYGGLLQLARRDCSRIFCYVLGCLRFLAFPSDGIEACAAPCAHMFVPQ